MLHKKYVKFPQTLAKTLRYLEPRFHIYKRQQCGLTETCTHFLLFAHLKQQKLISQRFSYVHFAYQNRRKRRFLETYSVLPVGLRVCMLKKIQGFHHVITLEIFSPLTTPKEIQPT